MTNVQCEPAVTALSGLLDEFRTRHIVALSDEKKGMEQHTSALSARWNDRFPGFPTDDFPYSSFRGEHYRKHRDATCPYVSPDQKYIFFLKIGQSYDGVLWVDAMIIKELRSMDSR